MPPFLHWQSTIVERTDGFRAGLADNMLSLGRDTLSTGHWLLLPALVLPWLTHFRKADARASRELLLAWCRTHVKPGQIVFREHYTLASNVAGVHEQLVGALADGVKKGRVLENAFDYVLISSLTYDRYFDA